MFKDNLVMSFQKILKLSSRYILSPMNIASISKQPKINYCSKVNSKFVSSGVQAENFGNDDIEENDGEPEEDLSKPLVKLTVFFPKENVVKEINARVGMTVLDAVLKYDTNLMSSACEGQLTCRTCHCLVKKEAMCHFTEPEDSEEDLLDAFANCQPNSRLACQMRILEEFENVYIEVVPEIKSNTEKKEESS